MMNYKVKSAFTVLLAVVFFSFSVLTYNVSNAESNVETLVEKAIVDFFRALKSGDVEAIESAIAGDLSARMSTLLHKNRQYPQFLRDYYQGSELNVEEIVEHSGSVIAKVQVILKGGNVRLFSMQLEQGTTGQFKIVKQNIEDR